MAAGKPAEGKIEEAEIEESGAVEQIEEVAYRVVAVRFTADFEYQESPSATRIYPKGWSGEIPEQRAQDAFDQDKAEPI